MIAVVESVWEQIQNHGISKNNHVSNIRAKTTLKFFGYNVLGLDVGQFLSISKKYQNFTKTEKINVLF